MKVENVWRRDKGKFRWVASMGMLSKIVAVPSLNAASLGDGDQSAVSQQKDLE